MIAPSDSGSPGGFENSGRAPVFFRACCIAASVILLICLSAVSVFADNRDYVAQLLARADAEKIHTERYWHILLHYTPTLTGYRSQVDDPLFFLSPEGNTRPREELREAIRLFFLTDVDQSRPEICDFIARYTWLKDRLDVDPDKVPKLSCDAVDTLPLRSATLVFPSYFLNNPASMFGHTFINIKTDYESEVLANAVNYAARTDETNGLVFAFKGVFGLYHGYYSVLPYYKKILEYSDMDRRDIWEYTLNLTPVELARMVRHIRELEPVYTRYFFFDENCSYNLLYLLEAARPSVHLTDRFHSVVIPIDTIKVIREAGLITSKKFRPSAVTRIQHQMSALSREDQQQVTGLITGDLPPDVLASAGLSPEETAKRIDLAVDGIKHRLTRKDMDLSDYRKRLLSLLRIRSRLPGVNAFSKPPIPAPPAPDQAHHSKQMRWGIGMEDHRRFMTLGFRPAFTDLEDPDYSRDAGVQIQMGNALLRYYPEDAEIEIERFDVLDITSLSPQTPLFTPQSWRISVGFRQMMTDNGTREASLYLDGGFGRARHTPFGGILYGLVEGAAELSSDLDHGYAIGSGAAAGWLVTVNRMNRFHLSARWLGFFAGDDHTRFRGSAIFRRKIDTQHHVQIEGFWEETFGKAYAGFQAELRWYLP